jgi:hypothetical protein
MLTPPDADIVEKRNDTVGQMSVAFVSEQSVASHVVREGHR